MEPAPSQDWTQQLENIHSVCVCVCVRERKCVHLRVSCSRRMAPSRRAAVSVALICMCVCVCAVEMQAGLLSPKIISHCVLLSLQTPELVGQSQLKCWSQLPLQMPHSHTHEHSRNRVFENVLYVMTLGYLRSGHDFVAAKHCVSAGKRDIH